MAKLDNDQIREQVDLIREVFYYSNKFKGATFVIKIDYEILTHPHFPILVKDLSILHNTGIRIVIIPGARNRIDSILDKYGVQCRKINNIRISSKEAMSFIEMAAFDVTSTVVTMLSANNVAGVIGNWVRARGLGIIDGVDYESTGTVEKIDISSITRILDEGYIPIFPCIGWNPVGKPYNISSNELASFLARELNAEKLFFVYAYDRFLESEYTLPQTDVVVKDNMISSMGIVGAREFIRQNDSREDYQFGILKLAYDACEGGVDRVHIVDGRIEGVILKEIFSNLGFGTMIHGHSFEKIREMHFNDISDVLFLMAPYVRKGILIPRDEEKLKSQYSDYVVYDVDGGIHACGAMHEYSGGLCEIAGLAVDQGFAHLGMGRKIVQYLLLKAREEGKKKVFVLTTQTSDWFERLGFEDGELSDLPEERRDSYNHSRKSRIFVFDIMKNEHLLYE